MNVDAMPKTYTLKGTDNKADIERRLSYLEVLFKTAVDKETHIAEMRQKNLNYSLITFAGLFSISWTLPVKTYSLFVSFALLLIMAVFCLLDRRYHMFIHGWRKTRKIINNKMNDIISNPNQDISFPRYAADGEKEAERFGLQPIISYLLVVGGGIHFLYFILSKYD